MLWGGRNCHIVANLPASETHSGVRAGYPAASSSAETQGLAGRDASDSQQWEGDAIHLKMIM